MMRYKTRGESKSNILRPCQDQFVTTMKNFTATWLFAHFSYRIMLSKQASYVYRVFSAAEQLVLFTQVLKFRTVAVPELSLDETSKSINQSGIFKVA